MVDCLKNVNVELKANIYFGGKVISHKIISDNDVMTMGVILPGEYEFSVGAKEIMNITSGTAEVLLPNENEWQKVEQGESFTVIANSSYKIKGDNTVEYLCSYINE